MKFRLVAICMLLLSAYDAGALRAAFSLSEASLTSKFFEEMFDDGSYETGWIFSDTQHARWNVIKTAGTMDFAAINPNDCGSLRIKGPADFADRELADALSPEFFVDGQALFSCYVGFSHEFDDMGALEIDLVGRNGATIQLWSSLNSESHTGWEWRKIEIPYIIRDAGTFRLRFRYTSGSLAAALSPGGCQASFYVDDISVSSYASAPEGTTITSGQSVQFFNHTDSPASLTWSFPGGTPSTSSEENPVVIYNKPGIYDVSLTAKNSRNISDTYTAKDFITVEVGMPEVRIKVDAGIRAEGSGLYALPPYTPVRFSPSKPDELSYCNWHIGSGCDDDDLVVRDGHSAIMEFNGEGRRTIIADAANQKGKCQEEMNVDVVKRARMSNIMPNDIAVPVSLSKLSDTLAEIYPKPAVPCAVDNVSFVISDAKASASATATASVLILKNGEPADVIASATTPIAGKTLPLSIDFPQPAVVMDTQWAVVLQLKGVTNANVATAHSGANSAMFKDDDGWRHFETHSFRFSPSCTYSVLKVTDAEVSEKMEFDPHGSTLNLPFMSLLDCRYILNAEWIKIVEERNGAYRYNLSVTANPLPASMQGRDAELLLTDGISVKRIKLSQSRGIDNVAGVDTDKLVSIVDGHIRLDLSSALTMSVFSPEGVIIARDVREYAPLSPGVYCVSVRLANGGLRSFRFVF